MGGSSQVPGAPGLFTAERPEELEIVLLDIARVGTVFRYPGGEAFEVEFLTAQGTTIAVLTLDRSEVRPLADGEILHARKVGS